VFSQLSAVITLRYLNTRILLHRPILARFLDHDDHKPGSAEEWAFLQQFGKSSLEVSILSALELIDIIHSVSECQHRMLTTWWFSIYYSEFLSIFHMAPLLTIRSVQCCTCGVQWNGSAQKAWHSTA